jgi:hypothetical protein
MVAALLCVAADASAQAKVKIETVSPAEGPQGGGTRVTITGAEFKAGAKVLIGGREATNVQLTSDSELTCVTPDFGNFEGKVAISIINADRRHATKFEAFKVVLGAAAPPPAPAPSINSVMPPKGGVAGGTTVTIGGANFKDGAKVTVGGQPATGVKFLDANALSAVTPALPAGAHDVVVTNPDGQSVTSGGAFTAEAAAPAPAAGPVVESVVPSKGPDGGGITIIVRGRDFARGATVTVGGKPATEVAVRGASVLTAVTPALGPGAHDVVVTNPDGQSGTGKALYTVSVPEGAAPTIESITPAKGPKEGGTRLVIRGTNFLTGAAVAIGNEVATDVAVRNPTTIEATTPAGAVGKVDVIVANPDVRPDGKHRVVAAGAFEYEAPAEVPPTPPTPPAAGLAVTKVEPGAGENTVIVKVLVKGSGFQKGAKVSVGGMDTRNPNVLSETEIQCFVPRLAPKAGPQDVVVTNPDGTAATLAGGYEATKPAPPVIEGVTPAEVPAKAGTVITVNGANFARGAKVSVGGVAATDVRVESPTRLSAATPDLTGRSGKLDVAVANPDGQAVVAKGAIGVAASGGAGPVTPPTPAAKKPEITLVDPSRGPEAGGTVFAVTGKEFAPDAVVLIGGRAALNVRVLGPTRLTAVTPSLTGLTGAVDVQVENPDGAKVTKPGAFTVEEPTPEPPPIDDAPVAPSARRPWGAVGLGAWFALPTGGIRNKNGDVVQFGDLGLETFGIAPTVNLRAYVLPEFSIDIEALNAAASGSDTPSTPQRWGGTTFGTGAEVDASLLFRTLTLDLRYNVWNHDRIHAWAGAGLRSISIAVELEQGATSKTEHTDAIYPFVGGAVSYDVTKVAGRWLSAAFDLRLGGLIGITDDQGVFMDVALRADIPVPLPARVSKFIDLDVVAAYQMRQSRTSFEEGPSDDEDVMRFDAHGLYLGLNVRF